MYATKMSEKTRTNTAYISSKDSDPLIVPIMSQYPRMTTAIICYYTGLDGMPDCNVLCLLFN